jgi:hypothetical protein
LHAFSDIFEKNAERSGASSCCLSEGERDKVYTTVDLVKLENKFTTFKTKLAAEILIATGSTAFTDAHATFDPSDTAEVAQARLDMMLDTNKDDTVDNDEIIAAYPEAFDTNGNGMIDANERAEAEIILADS